MAYRNPATTALRERVMGLFNQGDTLAEIADKLAITRGAAGRFVMEARAMGIPTVSYTRSEATQRHHVSLRAGNARRKSVNESPRPDTPE